MIFADFANTLLQAINVSSTTVHPTTTIFDDLALDSLQCFQLICAIEDMAGLLVPPEYLPPIFTLDDAYTYYQSALELAHR